ncbi:hypothetical protein IGJ01_002776 [Enterococcus sp. AZ089]|uniref:phage tail protein n=1 Tax=Enterococcus TaxID=1350 RepID=UPI0018AB6523|nr:phage tail protein [Enterococcus casseliflavus]MDB1710199.1 phage tail protein [Enterococcus casseliflavus]MDB1717663.1 phage tail protein [Enterococcus casseliflavus]
MTTENVRIAVRDAQDSQTLAFMDNSAPNAIHFDQADLTRFFEGDSTVLQMRFNKKHDRANAIREGSKLAFFYKGKDYWLNIITAKDVSHQRELMAFSLSLELNKEKVGFYAANTAMAFVEYLKSIDFEQTLTIGINEIADKKLKLDWDGDQSKLGRLYSLGNKFDAEISFETILNDDYSLKQQIINIYKKHDESNQGIGQDKTATTLRVGKDLKVINRSASLENFYSAIRGTGKDGISINDIEFEELDANGNVLYFSKKGQDVIWSPQARDAFPSKNNPGNDGYLVEKKGETEYTTVEALKGYLLSELKKNSSVYVDYETEGHFDSDPGDTFSLEDSVYYSPPLYLEARVYEQTESLVLGDFSSDKTTFSNFVEKTSEIDSSLLARVQALIEANKVFAYEIITSDGVTFKNGFGSTTLTARVRDGIKDVTDTFSLKWYKDGTLFSNTKTVTINAADIEEKAVFRFEVADDSGNVRGGAEVTVTNIDDGKKGEPGETYYPHRGYLMADGTFTKVYPNENLFRNSESPNAIAYAGATSTKTANVSVPEWNAATAVKYAISGGTSTIACTMPAGSMTTAGVKENYDISIYIKNTGTVDFNIGGNITTSTRIEAGEAKWVTFLAKDYSHLTGAARQFSITRLSVGAAIEFIVWRAKFAYGTYNSIWTPRPDEDYENAYPKYEGFYSDTNQVGSDNPDDYKPWTPFMGPQGPAGEDGKDGSDGANGQDAKEVISGYLSNDSIIVPANASGTVTDFTKALGDFIIYEGQTKVSSGVTYSKVSEIGMTSTINSAGRYTVTALSSDVGTVTYQAMYKAVTIQKIMIVVKNKQGATGPAGTNGTDGKGIVSSATTYQAGTSGTTPPTGTWSTSIPSVSENQYLWTKIVLTYSDNTNSTAYSLGKMGAKGETGSTGSTGATGATGNGIRSTTINFASSTSGTTAPSSGWTTSIPTVAAGSFLWTRTVLTFTDNTTNTSYTVAKQGEKGDPTGIISQATVPTNPYVGMLWQNTGASGYIIGATYQWNGSKFNLYIFTADNIVATTLSAITANLGTITAGTINGVTINSSEFVNPYTRQYNDGTFAQGTQRIGSAELYNSGVIKNSQGVTTQSYETIFSHQLVSMTRYTGDKVGDANSLISSASLSFDRLTLNDRQNGFSGQLTAQQLTSVPWVNIPLASGYITIEGATPQYRRIQLLDGSYEVQLRGRVGPSSGNFDLTGRRIGSIPYAASMLELFLCGANSGRSGRIQVELNGDLMVASADSGVTYISLSGIRFVSL